MNDSETSSRQAMGRLTLAIWVLTLVILIHIVLSLFGTLSPRGILGHRTEPSQGSEIASDDYEGFHNWPLDKQIDSASVIAVARYQKEGDRFKAVISEILKQAPGTEFYYSVGDEYVQAGYYPKNGTSYGDGQIIFFTGSPAAMRFACSFTGDRISGFGDMPFDVLQSKIKKQ